jgi:hypothetical protein
LGLTKILFVNSSKEGDVTDSAVAKEVPKVEEIEHVVRLKLLLTTLN